MTTPSLPEAIERVRSYTWNVEDVLLVCAAASRAEAAERERDELQAACEQVLRERNAALDRGRAADVEGGELEKFKDELLDERDDLRASLAAAERELLEIIEVADGRVADPTITPNTPHALRQVMKLRQVRVVLDQQLSAAKRELEAVRANLYAAMKVVAHARLAWQADHPALAAFDAATSPAPDGHEGE